MMTDHLFPGGKITVIHDIPEDQVRDGNIDVHVYLDSGAHYCTTFYTLRNIDYLFDKEDAHLGEKPLIPYAFDVSMIVVREISFEAIRETVAHLVRGEEIGFAMQLVDDSDDELE